MSTEKNLQNIIDLMRRDDSVDAPADSRRWASNLYRTRAVVPKASFVKKLAAVFQMEIGQNQPAFGERSASTSSARQMLYRADDHAVDIRIEESTSGFTVRGQVLGDGFENATTRLFDDDRSFEAAASETSEFRFDNVPAGRYELTIHSPGVEITLKSVEIS
ncbi:MAG: carboxypeptidase-like regulatory domain-containing protein [Acidobacteriota bacterium]